MAAGDNIHLAPSNLNDPLITSTHTITFEDPADLDYRYIVGYAIYPMRIIEVRTNAIGGTARVGLLTQDIERPFIEGGVGADVDTNGRALADEGAWVAYTLSDDRDTGESAPDSYVAAGQSLKFQVHDPEPISETAGMVVQVQYVIANVRGEYW